MSFLKQLAGIQFLVGLMLKSSILLSIALILNRCLRKKSAALRHFILSSCLILLLLMPLTSILIPNWDAGILPQLNNPAVENPQANRAYATSQTPGEILRRHTGPAVTHPLPGEESPPTWWQKLTPPHGLMLLWLTGLGMVFFNVMVGLIYTTRLTRQGRQLRFFPWTHLYHWYTRLRGLEKPVRLLENTSIHMPMSWGWFRPVVLIPQQANNWSIDQCRAVLFHELCHIERKDFLVKLAGRITCGFYWYNPLTWLVFRKLKIEQEKACDERVLLTGIKPSIYASSLLRLKRTMEGKGMIPVTANGILEPGSFTDRLASILKKQIYLKEMNMKSKLFITIFLVFAVAIIGTANPFKSKLSDPLNQEQQQEKIQKKEKKSPKELKAKKNKLTGKAITLYITDSDSKDGKKLKTFTLKKGHLIVKGGDQVLLLNEDGKTTELKLDGKGVNKLSFKADKILLKSGKKGTLLYKIEGEGASLAWTVREKGSGKNVSDADTVTVWIQKGDEDSAKASVKTRDIYIRDGGDGDVMILRSAEGRKGKGHYLISRDNSVVLSIINEGDGEMTYHVLVTTKSTDKKEIREKISRRIKQFAKEIPASFKTESQLEDNVYKITVKNQGGKSKAEVIVEVKQKVKELCRDLKKILPPSRKKNKYKVEV